MFFASRHFWRSCQGVCLTGCVCVWVCVSTRGVRSCGSCGGKLHFGSGPLGREAEKVGRVVNLTLSACRMWEAASMTRAAGMICINTCSTAARSTSCARFGPGSAQHDVKQEVVFNRDAVIGHECCCRIILEWMKQNLCKPLQLKIQNQLGSLKEKSGFGLKPSNPDVHNQRAFGI